MFSQGDLRQWDNVKRQEPRGGGLRCLHHEECVGDPAPRARPEEAAGAGAAGEERAHHVRTSITKHDEPWILSGIEHFSL